MEEGKMSDLQYWLTFNGFLDNPFLLESFHAETDYLLGHSLIGEYVERDDINLLIGSFDAAGYRLIFSKPGGGKSGIRMQTHWKYENIDQFSEKPRALILDYVQHNYLLGEATSSHHVNRIICLAETILDKKFAKEKRLLKKSPRIALESLVQTVRKEFGYEGIYVLVDNIDSQSFEKILPLVLSTDLFDVEGLIPKFFVPDNLMLAAQSASAFRVSPPYYLQWNENDLLKILDQRLVGFLDSKFRSSTVVPGVSFLCEGHISEDVQNCFIKIGVYGGGPGAMWEFGNLLIEEHMKQAPRKTDLINNNSFSKARLKLFDRLLKFDPALNKLINENLDRKFNNSLRASARVKPKATVFLHCIEENEEEVYQILYQALEAENYRPWMASKDIIAGEKRRLSIENALNGSDFFIPCLSSQSVVARNEFQRYLKLALDKYQNEMLSKDIFIIPFLVDKCDIPIELKELGYIDRNNRDFFITLLKSLEKGMKIRKGKKT